MQFYGQSFRLSLSLYIFFFFLSYLVEKIFLVDTFYYTEPKNWLNSFVMKIWQFLIFPESNEMK